MQVEFVSRPIYPPQFSSKALAGTRGIVLLGCFLASMDYRRVEKPYRSCACLVHMTLLVSLVFYAVFQVYSVVASANNPPVKVTEEHWKGAGKWAVCGENELLGAAAGIGIGTSHEFLRSDDVEMRTPNGELRLQEIPVAGHARNCSILDLSEEPVATLPFQMSLCSAVKGNGYVLLETNSQWETVSYLSNGWLRQVYLQRKKQGWNYGYSSILEDLHTVFVRFDSTYGLRADSREYMCGEMTWFQPPPRTPVGCMLVTIDTLVTVTHKQGILPQVLTLFSEVGGYLSLLTAMFTCFFVKKYTDSPVAKIYEARTFVGENISKNLQLHGKDEKTEDTPVPLPFPPGLWGKLDTE